MPLNTGIHFIWATFSLPVLVGLIAVPFGAVEAWALARARIRTGRPRALAWRRSVAEVAMVIGTVPWIWMILTPDPGHARGENLIPFHDLINQFHAGVGYAFVQITGNLLVFAALGFFLPVRFRVGPTTVLVIGVLGSATVEILQWVLHLGRFSSVDDVMVNAAGAFAAAWLSRPWWARRRELGRPGSTVIPVDSGDDAGAPGRLPYAGHDRAAYVLRRSAGRGRPSQPPPVRQPAGVRPGAAAERGRRDHRAPG